jgi:hypothetical protein
MKKNFLEPFDRGVERLYIRGKIFHTIEKTELTTLIELAVVTANNFVLRGKRYNAPFESLCFPSCTPGDKRSRELKKMRSL